MGTGPLHRVWQVRDGLSALNDSREGLLDQRSQRAPAGFKTMPAKWRELPDKLYTIQVAVEDCTGCRLCVEVCPAKDKRNVSRKSLNMHPQLPLRDSERVNWDYFLTLPEISQERPDCFHSVKNVQLLQPLFEFSGACAGCGETPYIKLMTQLFGDRAIIANATGCSSIYGGNLPTTPYTTNREGRGPAWSNSLFEDNAEFGLGMRSRSIIRMPTQRIWSSACAISLARTLADGMLKTDSVNKRRHQHSTRTGCGIESETRSRSTSRKRAIC